MLFVGTLAYVFMCMPQSLRFSYYTKSEESQLWDDNIKLALNFVIEIFISGHTINHTSQQNGHF